MNHLYHTEWDALSAKQWQALYEKASFCPLQQHYAYGEVLQGFGATVLRGVTYHNNQAIALTQLLQRKKFGVFRFNLILRGPLLLSSTHCYDSEALITNIIASAPQTMCKRLIISPPSPCTHPKFKAIMTEDYAALWDISPDIATLRANMKPKWRSALKQGEASGLHIITGSQAHHYEWLLEQEKQQQYERGYKNMPPAFIKLYHAISIEKRPLLYVAARYQKTVLAAQLFVQHGNSASYMIGWNSEEGRARSAHHLLLLKAATMLRKRAVHTIDLGRINTHYEAGLTRFKLGTGAASYPFPGPMMQKPFTRIL